MCVGDSLSGMHLECTVHVHLYTHVHCTCTYVPVTSLTCTLHGHSHEVVLGRGYCTITGHEWF